MYVAAIAGTAFIMDRFPLEPEMIMALWKEQTGSRKDVPDTSTIEVAPRPEVPTAYAPPVEAPRPVRHVESAESVIGPDLAIEGSITGAGSVRLAGKFTGDVTVDGVLTIETGARLAGSVRASTVAIAGELEGNVVKATRVDVHASGVLMGDLKSDTLTLAAGSRVRGHIECGWVEAPAVSSRLGSSTSTPLSSASVKHSSGSQNGVEAVAGT
jgi:cytoskeletal protein CcmA (bactofilin family)